MLENVKGILSVCTFLGIGPLDFCAKDLCCAACQQSQPKRPHTHTHAHTHMCIYSYMYLSPSPPSLLFWPSLIDCLTSGPANNLQFLLQSQSASCLFLSHRLPLFIPPRYLPCFPFSFILELLLYICLSTRSTDTSRVSKIIVCILKISSYSFFAFHKNIFIFLQVLNTFFFFINFIKIFAYLLGKYLSKCLPCHTSLC